MSGEIDSSSSAMYAVVDVSRKKKKVSNDSEKCMSGDMAVYAVVNKSKLTNSSIKDTEIGPSNVKIFEKANMKKEENPSSTYSVLGHYNSSDTEPETPGSNRSGKAATESTTGKLKFYLLVLSFAIIFLLIALIICIAVALTRISKINSDLEHSVADLKSEIEYAHNTSNDIKVSTFLLIEQLNASVYEIFNSFSDDTNVSVSYIWAMIRNITEEIAVLNKTIVMEHDSIYEDIHSIVRSVLGYFRSSPAPSCEAIYQTQAVPTSGYYWLRSTNRSSVEVYCEMTRTCGGSRGGRMRVVQLNDSTRSEICTGQLKIRSGNSSQCVLQSDARHCSRNIFNVMNIQYSHICGTVEGYGNRTVDGFINMNAQRVSDNYVDGISLALDNPSTTHVWTFVALTRSDIIACPTESPSFVGVNYSCLPWINKSGVITTCSESMKCSQSFNMNLDQPTSDNIEMRLCRDQGRGDEDIVVGNIEIYVW